MKALTKICHVSIFIYLVATQSSYANAFDDKIKALDTFAAHAFPLDNVSSSNSISIGASHFTKTYNLGEDSFAIIMVERLGEKDVITDVIRITKNWYEVVLSDLRILEEESSQPVTRCVACNVWGAFGVEVINPSPLSPYVLFEVNMPSHGGFSIVLDYDTDRDFEDLGMRMSPGDADVCFFYKAPVWAQDISETCTTPPFATPVKISRVGDKDEISIAIYLPKRKVTTDWSGGIGVDARLFSHKPDNLQAFERVGFQLGDR